MKTPQRGPSRERAGGFTLVELLVACVIMTLMMVMIMSITNMVSKTWKATTVKMEAFDAARSAFDRMTKTLSQAVLNPYWDYDSPTAPTRYERRSELQFLSLPMKQLGPEYSEAYFPTHALFFQAPTGAVSDKAAHGQMPLLLNAFGYFIEYGDDSLDRPGFLNLPASPVGIRPRYRYRLKEWRVPSENFALYAKSSGVAGRNYLGTQTLDWIDPANPAARPLAENIVAMVVYPKNTENVATASASLVDPGFLYNSRNNGATALNLTQRHQLPPEVEIILVAVTEDSFLRAYGNSESPPGIVGSGLFQDPAEIEADLATLTRKLDDSHVEHLVLRSTVKIRGARWSQN